MDARGGLRGPNLTSGRLLHGDSDPELFRTILRGIPGTQMPANNYLSEEETWEVIAHLRTLQPKRGRKLCREMPPRARNSSLVMPTALSVTWCAARAGVWDRT